MTYNKETFKILMSKLGWVNLNTLKKPYSPDHRGGSIYTCNGFFVTHRNYYLVVKGQVPTVNAIDLHENFNSDKLAIRVNGHGCNIAPTFENSENDEVMRLCKKLVDKREFNTSFQPIDDACNDLRDKLIESKPEDFYISLYHIDTWEGLEVFTNYVKENKIVSRWFE